MKSGYAYKRSEWTDAGVPVIKIQNVRDGCVTMEGTSFVSEATAARTSSFRLTVGDLLITMSGEIGAVGMVRASEPLMLNQRVGRFEVTVPEKLDDVFLLHVLRTPNSKALLLNAAHGAAQANISPTLIGMLEIPLPALSTQRKVAAVLSAYDDLIENNNRRIKILEEMAQRIYREWFVDFRYPGHEGVPLVDSELGPVPQGWTAVRLEVACEFTSGKPIPASERGSGNTAVFGANGVLGQTTLPPLHGPCSILGKIGSCGSLHRSFEPCWVTNNAFAVHPGAITSSNLVWLTLSNIDLSPFVGGAANPYLPLPTFGHLPIAVGPQHVFDTFDQLFGPLFELSKNLRAQIERLSLARDLLLPRLVSGEIDVTDLDIAMPEVV